MKKCLMSAVLVWCAYAAPAQASSIMLYEEVGLNVVGTLSGSLDLTGMTGIGGFGVAAVGVRPLNALFSTGQVGNPQTGFFDQITGPSSFGPGGTSFPNSSIGDAVFLFTPGNDFWVPGSYVSGGPLSATQTFTNRTFATMGLTLGDYVYTLSSGDTLTVRVGAAVPEPATLTLLGVVLAGVGARRWRARRTPALTGRIST